MAVPRETVQTDIPAGGVAAGKALCKEGRDITERHSAFPPPFLCNASIRRRSGPPLDTAHARPRPPLYHPDLHSRRYGPAEADLSRRSPESLAGTKRLMRERTAISTL